MAQDQARRPTVSLLRALSSRNYRLFFGGQSVSLVGTWMQRITVSWLVWRLTGSAFLLGAVGFAGQIPTFFLAPLAGVLADRLDRYRMLVTTQTLSMIQAALLAALALSGRITIQEIMALAALLGAINAFDVPARQSFVVEMVETPADLPNAIALNSTMVNAARMIGPTLAGYVIGWIGEGMSFLANAASFVAVIGALLAMRIEPRKRVPSGKRLLAEMREGVAYVAGHRPILGLILSLGVVSLVGMPYTQLMPIFATKIFHGGPHTLGILMGATGVGAIIGTLLLASSKDAKKLGKVLFASLLAFGVGLVAFALSRTFWASLLFLGLTGAGMMVQIAGTNTALQALVDDAKRGRVMSFYAMAFMGMGPIGSLLAGTLASRIGAPKTLAIGGSICVLAALLFSRRFLKLAIRLD